MSPASRDSSALTISASEVEDEQRAGDDGERAGVEPVEQIAAGDEPHVDGESREQGEEGDRDRARNAVRT